MSLLSVMLVAAIAAAAVAPVSAARPLASVRLYNPGRWSGPTVVEVPVGRLASPGLVDWRRVRLVAAGREIPFTLREGRPHWKASLIAPVASPRAEDLLVFTCAVPPGRWLTVDALSGRTASASAIRRRAGRLVVSYPRISVSVDAGSGMLQSIRSAGVQLLRHPLITEAWRAEAPPVRPGEFGPGPRSPLYEVKRTSPLPAPKVEMVSSSSTPAMTELNFVLRVDQSLSLSLTYRIHAAGLVEICADERPWSGRSPWIDRAVSYSLDPAGDRESLPDLENRAPFYGFKDFNAVVHYPAAIYRSRGASLLMLGDETANGRRWSRKLYLATPGESFDVPALVEAANDGLVVIPVPVSVVCKSGAARVVCPDADRAAGEKLAEGLARAGIRIAKTDSPADAETVAMRIVDHPAAHGISGDGFAVRRSAYGLDIISGTRFGLFHAACRIAEQLGTAHESSRGNAPVLFPLIASNPAVDFRSGGFGGGDFEVDFPYGDDAEWERVLSALAGSGMNVMADLGMWSNWKMPVSYRYMPELRSNAPDAYDEVSGAKFSEFERDRKRGLKLLRFLHDRGVQVWLWLPIGAVPTTYAHVHPEAMSPHSAKIPCFTHSLYNRYLSAFLKEVLETYPIDGVVMIRDDNGGICDCDRCRAYLASSRTHSPVWEQYLVLYDHLRNAGFKGGIGIYPYFDHYDPAVERLLPKDLYIIGHGSGLGLLTRDYATCGPMGDTWLDNLFACFRLPGSTRMKRLLSDRSSFWVGGAYHGSELPWEAVGRFGWEPTLSVNTFRYEWGVRTFGQRAALSFVGANAACDRLWELNDLPILPINWFALTAAERESVQREGAQSLATFRKCLAALRAAVGPNAAPDWFRQIALFGTFFETHIRRLAHLSEMHDLVAANRATIEKGARLPEPVRQRLLYLHGESYRDADALAHEAAAARGDMMRHTRDNRLLSPYHEWGMQPYGWYLEEYLKDKQFAGGISAVPTNGVAGRPFTLRVTLHNTGFVPWAKDAGQHIELGGEAARLGLPARWYYDGDPMAPGDARTIEIHGTAPAQPGTANVTLSFYPPFDSPVPTMKTNACVTWR